ncbi:hypothetical protein [Paenibacillus puerhi]|uniref:hypothetical protein n=1 Tax=Paenibacillus puerhi TaxID=2692622 RepID=UPI0013589EB7|nr:hypothetical protein [Paenibacillus puerhi]
MVRKLDMRIGIPIIVVVLYVGFIFMLDPLRVTGWLVIPLNNHYGKQFLSNMIEGHFQAASSALSRDDADKGKWTREIEGFKERGFYAVSYTGLKIPHDRERMDGHAAVTFMVNGQQETYPTVLTFSLDGMNQACIQSSSDSTFVKEWNRINCYFDGG